MLTPARVAVLAALCLPTAVALAALGRALRLPVFDLEVEPFAVDPFEVDLDLLNRS